MESIGGVIASLGRDSKGVPNGFIVQMQDITQRKKAEIALRESEARFRNVFESAAFGMTIVGPDDHLIDANRAYQELLGYELDELREMLTADNTHPKDVLVDANLFAEILEGKRENYHMEKRYFRKDGTLIYVGLSVTGIRDSSGLLIYVIGMTEDITSRKQTEKELLLTQFVVERSTDSALRILPDGSITYANEAACQSLGYSKDELLLLKVFDVDSEITRDTWFGEWSDFTKQGSLMKQSVHKTKDGEFFPVEINANYVIIDKEEYNFTFARDISERKQAQKILAQSEKRKDSMIRAAPVGIGLVSDRVMTFVSDTFVNMIEYTREELLGQDARMLYESDEEYQRVGRVKYDQIREQGTGSLETRMVTKSGRIINVDLRSTPIDIDDSSSEVTFTAMDITVRKETEEKLEKRTHELLERIKEINCLYYASDILKNTDTPLEEAINELIEIIPAAYQYPDITSVRVSLDNEYTSQNFAESIWMQSADIISSDSVRGTIEVYYSASKPELDEGPFLIEERDLINTLANQIGEFIERGNTQRELRESERKHRTIVESMQDLVFVYDSLDYYTEYYAASAHLLYNEQGSFLGKHV
ncbi:MAG: PAS domain S-box protein, partial [Candidatus Thorarchaeota archaeon]|nr:PAS domain S-box protein [Candidatus Thorarchaeota archaeon]